MILELTHNFSFKFEGNIWKILLDEQKKVLLLEIRTETYQVSFAAIDLIQGQLLWKSLVLEEPWWVSMQEAYNGVLFFHTYQDSQTPKVKGIIAWDVYQNKELWRNENITFYSIHQSCLVACQDKTESKDFLLLDIFTGKLLQKEINFSLISEGLTKNIQYPYHYKAESSYFTTVSKFFKKYLDIDITHAVDYLEHKNLMIISYFYIKDSELRNNLIILNNNVEQLLRTCINKELKGVMLDSFLVFDYKLFFIKNKAELVSYHL